MKVIRFQKKGQEHWGILEEDRIFLLEGDLYGDFKRGKEIGLLKEVKLLAPAVPSIMVCCGMNYPERFKEDYSRGTDLKPTGEPIIFFKPPTAVIGPGEDILFPGVAETLRYEAELCVVMKRRARNVPEREALDYVLGYTCGNELGALDLMKRDKWLTRAKGFDTAGPLGPCLATGLDPHHLSIRSWVNDFSIVGVRRLSSLRKTKPITNASSGPPISPLTSRTPSTATWSRAAPRRSTRKRPVPKRRPFTGFWYPPGNRR